jgi:hypothetical protein
MYLSPGQDPTNTTKQVLQAASNIKRSDGSLVPLAPFLSWVYEGPRSGPHFHCSLSLQAMRAQLSVLSMRGKTRVPMIIWFNGRDNKTDMCHGFVNQLAYMRRGSFVPARCQHQAQ